MYELHDVHILCCTNVSRMMYQRVPYDVTTCPV